MIFSLSFYLVLIDDYPYYLYIVYNCVYVFSVPMSFGDENKDIYIYIRLKIKPNSVRIRF
jgi:hypothetical protein